MNNILTAYFSRDGENWFDRKLVDLKKGNTQIVAEKAAALTNSDIFTIEPKVKYSDKYKACVEQAKKDKESDARPELKDYLNDISQYDTIILCYPNYCSTMPMHVFTFLEHYDFSGKTILPICTHEGSAMGNSEKDIKRLCPKATVKKGLAIKGSSAENCDEALKAWIENQNV